MATRVLIPQPILPAGYEYLRKHGYEAVDGRGFTEEDIITDIRDCDALIVRTARITRQIFDAAPKLKILARHGAGYDGVDLAAEKGTAVTAAEAGTVAEVVMDPLWGGTVAIDHRDGTRTVYCGVAPEKALKAGDRVTAGQVLGSVDTVTAEVAMESHLHFAAKKDGKYIDPMTLPGLK